MLISIFSAVLNGTCVLGFWCKWNFLFPSVTCVVYSVVAFNVSLTLLCDDAKFK